MNSHLTASDFSAFRTPSKDNSRDIIHIDVRSNHIYIERALLTSVKGTKLAELFSKDQSFFVIDRCPKAFNLLVEFLTYQGLQLGIQGPDCLKDLLTELEFWGILTFVHRETIKRLLCLKWQGNSKKTSCFGEGLTTVRSPAENKVRKALKTSIFTSNFLNCYQKTRK